MDGSTSFITQHPIPQAGAFVLPVKSGGFVIRNEVPQHLVSILPTTSTQLRFGRKTEEASSRSTSPGISHGRGIASEELCLRLVFEITQHPIPQAGVFAPPVKSGGFLIRCEVPQHLVVGILPTTSSQLVSLR